MTNITYDAITDLKCALCSQWCTCCSGCTPNIREIWCAKLVGWDSESTEQIIIEAMPETVKPFDLFGKAYWHEVLIKIDIRSYTDICRHNTIVKEVSRILKNIIRRDSQGFLQVVIGKGDERSKDYRNMYKFIQEVVYQDVQTHTFV